MKLAIHSISWGDALLAEVLPDVVRAGYRGVELFQTSRSWRDAGQVHEQFAKNGVSLIGVCAGSFEDRCVLVREYCKLLGISPSSKDAPYVYVDEWHNGEDRFESVLREGLRLAIHPHMYKPIQTMTEVEEVFKRYEEKRYPTLRFLPDVAHIHIAGNDPVEAVKKFATRIDAIHLKDWHEYVGRSYQFYGRGFCELGDGDCPIGPLLEWLLANSYDGWLVVEQDSSPNAYCSATKSKKWFDSRISGDSSKRRGTI